MTTKNITGQVLCFAGVVAILVGMIGAMITIRFGSGEVLEVMMFGGIAITIGMFGFVYYQMSFLESTIYTLSEKIARLTEKETKTK